MLFTTRRRVAVVGVGLAVAAGGAISSAPEASAKKPSFTVPFSCGQTWRGSAWTTSGGHPHNPMKSVDWNWGAGNDDKGKLVRASAAGTVETAGTGPGGYGKMVLIRHGSSGWQTRYAHLLKGSLAVEPGQTVTEGQVIGKVGQSGGQPTSHLHYEQIQGGHVQDAVVQGVRFAPDSVHHLTSSNAC